MISLQRQLLFMQAYADFDELYVDYDKSACNSVLLEEKVR